MAISTFGPSDLRFMEELLKPPGMRSPDFDPRSAAELLERAGREERRRAWAEAERVARSPLTDRQVDFVEMMRAVARSQGEYFSRWDF